MIEMYVRLITGMDTWMIDRVPPAWKEPVLAELKLRGYDGNGGKLPPLEPVEPTPETEQEVPTENPTEEPPTAEPTNPEQ